MMYRSPERSPQDFRDGFFLYSAQAPFYWPRVDLAILFAILFVLSCHVYFPLQFEFRGKSCVEWEHVGENGISCFLPCILLLYIEWIWTNYCKLSRNFVRAIRTTTINCRVSFIELYLVFPRNFRMVFLPYTNTVILMEPYCGTMTEPGLPVLLWINTEEQNNTHRSYILKNLFENPNVSVLKWNSLIPA